MSDFNVTALEQLTDQQVRFTPPGVRQLQLDRARALRAQVKPGRQYPFQFVCFRITDYRTSANPNLLIRGEDLRHDLDLFLDRVARSLQTAQLEMPAEPLLSLNQVSTKLKVSTKTVARWRKRGLIGQHVVHNGRRQLAFPKSVVDQFLANHPKEVERGSRFSQLTDGEKDEIIRRARRLAFSGGGLTDVSRRIAKRLGRSAEAIRLTIKGHDRLHPDSAVFPTVTGPLSADAKHLIYTSYRRGITVDTLAKRFKRTPTSVYRVIKETRATELLKKPVDYIYNEEFDDPAKEADILAGMPDEDKFQEQLAAKRVPKDVPAEMAHLYEYPLLTKPQEQHLFRQMNYLKHRLHRIQEHLEPGRVRTHDLDHIEELQAKIDSVRERLIRCNMRLVVSYAKKHVGVEGNLWELISDGNMSLLRAVEKFNYGFGNKFSTYASWAIMKNFARSIPDEKNHRERFVTGHDEMFEAKTDYRSDEQEQLTQAEQAANKVNRLLELLDPREREILRMRAGLDNEEGLTLEEIGQRMGITKERVRQLNARIMKKLRDYATEQKMDA
ncbi:MAG: sigma-70 family RNA polymerase sigma factor [Gemmataceae bacterium]